MPFVSLSRVTPDSLQWHKSINVKIFLLAASVEVFAYMDVETAEGSFQTARQPVQQANFWVSYSVHEIVVKIASLSIEYVNDLLLCVGISVWVKLLSKYKLSCGLQKSSKG